MPWQKNPDPIPAKEKQEQDRAVRLAFKVEALAAELQERAAELRGEIQKGGGGDGRT